MRASTHTGEHDNPHCGYLSDVTSVLAYLLAVLLVPVALSLMLFVMAHLEREPTPTPQATPYVPVETPTPIVATDGKPYPSVGKNAPSAA